MTLLVDWLANYWTDISLPLFSWSSNSPTLCSEAQCSEYLPSKLKHLQSALPPDSELQLQQQVRDLFSSFCIHITLYVCCRQLSVLLAMHRSFSEPTTSVIFSTSSFYVCLALALTVISASGSCDHKKCFQQMSSSWLFLLNILQINLIRRSPLMDHLQGVARQTSIWE